MFDREQPLRWALAGELANHGLAAQADPAGRDTAELVGAHASVLG